MICTAFSDEFKKKYGYLFRLPSEQNLIYNYERKHGRLPENLKSFFLVTNGFFSPKISIFPLFDKNCIKETWECFERVNDIQSTKFNVDESFFNQFYIIGQLEGMKMCMLDKISHQIWYETHKTYDETSIVSIFELIEGVTQG